jgi:hypothetical protein
MQARVYYSHTQGFRSVPPTVVALCTRWRESNPSLTGSLPRRNGLAGCARRKRNRFDERRAKPGRATRRLRAAKASGSTWARRSNHGFKKKTGEG